MINSKQIAEHATMQSFLNCYVRETNNFQWDEQSGVLTCALHHVGGEIQVKVNHFSLTGRHTFQFPAQYSWSGIQQRFELDFVTMVALLSKELNLSGNNQGSQDELLLRVIQSCQQIETFVESRQSDLDTLHHIDASYIETEQGLLFGHLLHPTPKSRQGFNEEEVALYSPEMKGQFALHYFRVHTSIVEHDSALPISAIECIKQELLSDELVCDEFKQQYCQQDEYALLPVHPWEAQYLLNTPKVKALIQKKVMQDVGKVGRAFAPTSSVRTVYDAVSSFMYKFSLHVKITNSLRVNKRKELERGVEVTRLLQTSLGEAFKAEYPGFDIITDPAYITLRLDDEQESGFEVMLRDNPFTLGNESDSMPLVALGQDHPLGKQSRLGVIIEDIAKREGRSTEQVSKDWFRQYLSLSLHPLMWLYDNYGIALEAHQQNSIVKMQDGYPSKVYYRDNQGYYFCKSMQDKLNALLPGISEKSETICDDSVADERFRYYFFFNHLFGLINAFGSGHLVEEKDLLIELRHQLEAIRPSLNRPSPLLDSLLENETLLSKGNLLTRFYDMDELVGSMETQSVYTETQNPLTIKEVKSVAVTP
ncbi:IucA/IucC family protein [Longirhabdus pacifica]|uniref:IucA/IucC family protein n=1 Tax=Longirhabdus pacifica TaxID=2305227 RepID=UPI0010089E2E|nr:IucA/IucC family protein [Longirhabdus pacifica]